MDFTFSQAISKLSSIGQQPLLVHWNRLSSEQQKGLLNQIARLDIDQFNYCQLLLKQKPPSPSDEIEPIQDISYSGNTADIKKGKQLLSDGLCGTVILAGGQGTRLKFNGPKGLYPITPIKHKSLFQLFSEKTLAASKQAGRPLSAAFMTSPLNHRTTLDFFEKNSFFGLHSEQISFFSQEMLPLLDQEGHLFLDENHQMAEGPDGNGSFFYHFVHSGLWNKWHEKGIRYLNIILIDNPLADPFDAELIGFHARQGCDVTVKCCIRENPDEKVGVLAQKNKRLHVVEYTEMSREEQTAREADGTLKYRCANLSLFCFGMDSILYLSKKYKEMPLHLAHKNNVWKFEKFIFDVLPMSEQVKAIAYPRERCFAPLKNYQGPDSLASVQKAMQLEDRRIFEEIAGIKPPDHLFELSQDFYYPTPSLLQVWKGRPLPAESYIEGS